MFNSLRKCWILSHSGCTILRTHHNAGELNAHFSRSVIFSISWVFAHEKTFSHQLEMNYSSCYKNRVNANSFRLIINFQSTEFYSSHFQWQQGRFPFSFVCFSLSLLYYGLSNFYLFRILNQYHLLFFLILKVSQICPVEMLSGWS